MIKGGMNILRLNLSMGSKERYAEVIRRVRSLEKSYGHNPSVGIALDLSAPPSVDGTVVLQKGQMTKLTIDGQYENKTTSSIIWINSLNFPSILNSIATGDRIYIDEGMISLIVRDVEVDSISCFVEQGGNFASGYSFLFKPRATRAEISDVANAVLDGADGLILTVETSRGLFPKESLTVLHKTCREAESTIFHERFWIDLKTAREVRGLSTWDPAYFACLAAVEASTTSNSSAIFVITTSGRSALAIASFHPSCPVVAIMRRPEVARKCHSIRGIHPFVYTGEKLSEWSHDMDTRLNAALDFAKMRGFVGAGDQIIVVTGQNAGSGSTNTVRICEIPPKNVPLSFVKSQSSFISEN
ncbi:unnamed protein product [Schistosoma margrebowiei]|uniref:pyruvate kinase n=1 Tax=Schistosoma margrebowiei TaxID=48269 RepID=A0A183MGI8_9TREM|nr:unnamed protein product [Schistosoma margrebowiei]